MGTFLDVKTNGRPEDENLEEASYPDITKKMNRIDYQGQPTRVLGFTLVKDPTAILSPEEQARVWSLSSHRGEVDII